MVRARDGVEALDYLFGCGTYAERDVLDFPAVTLLDLNLPKVNGLEVLEAIRVDERTRHLPIVILTSSNEDNDRLGSYDHFANSYVLKPVDYDQFAAAALQLGLYWMVSNVPPPRKESKRLPKKCIIFNLCRRKSRRAKKAPASSRTE